MLQIFFLHANSIFKNKFFQDFVQVFTKLV
jgi:hypothetical protein